MRLVNNESIPLGHLTQNAITQVAFSPHDGDHLLASALSSQVVLHDVTANNTTTIWDPHGNGVVAAATFSPNGRRPVLGGSVWGDSGLKQGQLWDVTDVDRPKPICDLPLHETYGAVFSHDSRKLACADYGSGTIAIFDSETGEETQDPLPIDCPRIFSLD